MAKKKAHGGKRKGSGRKPTNPEGRTMLVAVTVPVELVERLDGAAKERGLNRSQAVTEAIRGMLDAKR
jgi:post-segregation antitoxin (ccd killing protein)